MVRYYFIQHLLILFFFLFTATVVLAEEKISVVRIGIFELAPLIYSDDNDSPQGIFVDIIEEIANEESWKVEYVKGTWKEGLERIKKDQIDLMTAVMHLPRRESFLDFPRESVFNIWGQIYIHKDANVSGVFDMEGKTVGVLKGGANGENFIELQSKLGIQSKLISFDSQEDTAQAIKEKRVDAGVFTNIHGYKYQLSHQLKQTQIVFDPSYLKYATAEGTNQQLLSTIDSYLSKWKSNQNSPYYKIIEKHLGLSKNKEVPDWVWTIVIIGVSIIGVILLVVSLLMIFNKKLKNEVKAGTQDLVVELDRRKTTEKKLKKSEDRFRGIVYSMADWIWEVDSDGRYTYCSEKVVSILGYSPEEMLGKTPFDFMAPHEAEKIGGAFNKVVAQKKPIKNLENWNISKDGRHVCLLTNGLPLLDENKELFGFRGVDSDITEHKRAEAEKQRLESQLQQTQKMETIGTLAGGIAHDFNNILFPILGYSEMLLDDFPEDSQFYDDLNKIYTGAIRAKGLVKQILTFSRQERSDLKLMKIQPIIKEALKFIRSTIPTTININQDIQSNCGVIKADPTQIHQVIMNLTTNAYHAMEDTGGELKVILKEVELEEPNLISPDMEPGVYACLTIADQGIGMDKNLTKKIFDPFFTTKEKGKGTGMGLSVVHGIVNRMGGGIRVNSEPGKGTEFNVYIPVGKSSSEEDKRQVKQSIQGGTEQILLVDDEEAIITMEKQMLERLGYKVTSRTSSIEALEAFRANPHKFDLIITDIAMPNLSGDKLAVELIKIRPDIPILLCTGFSEKIPQKKAASLGIKDFLMKPIAGKDLAQKIRKVLDKNNN